MGIFSKFSNINPEYLKDDELESAKLLQSIVNGYANGNPNYIPNGVIKLSFGIYLMAFNRTKFDLVPLEILNNKAFLEKRPHLKPYLIILENIKHFMNNVVKNENIKAKHQGSALFKTIILKVLKESAADIEKINM